MAAHQNRTQALFAKVRRISCLSSSAKPEAVHELRTSIRRIETLLAASSPSSAQRKEQKLLKQLARLRRRAGKLRDLDVQIKALSSLRLDSTTRERARVRKFLDRARAKRENKLLKSFRNEVVGGLHKRLKRASARLEDESRRPNRPNPAEHEFLAAALEKFAALVKQRPIRNESNLHDFRLDCKRARYLAEMAGDDPAAAGTIEQLKRIQDSIGSWHDWLTLTATAENVLSRSGQVPLIAALRARTHSKYLEALRITADAQRVLLEMRESKRQPAKSAGPVAAKASPGAAVA
jgi:CHAD domain-containing protein